MLHYIDKEHAPSILPDGKKWTLVWNDEFDGDALDATKWDYRLHLLHQRHDTFTNEGVTVSDSKLKIALIEKDGQYYSAQLQTGYNFLDKPSDSKFEGANKFEWPIAKLDKPKFMHKYGYYECRCKLQEQPGWWSAFWLQSPIIGASLDPSYTGIECDIMENFKRDGTCTCGNIWGGYGHDQVISGSDKRTGRLDYNCGEGDAEGFHIFAVDWSPEGYIFYCDGREVSRTSDPVSDCEQFILVTTECMGYRRGNDPSPELKKAVLPDYFTVDYVRVYDEVK